MNYRTLVFSGLAMILFSSTLSAYSGGNGSAGDPYRIANAADFMQVSTTAADWDKYFILTADVNLSGRTFTEAPIAPDATRDDYSFSGTPFSGVFDGNGHVLSNLTISASEQEFVGLFGLISTDGQVKNLCVTKVNISGGYSTGGLAGENDGALTSCYVTGSISSASEAMGGLVGYNHLSVTYCYAAVSVSGSYYVGGLIGFNDGAVTSSYAAGSVSGYEYVGGLTGYDMGVTTCCYATCGVYGIGNVGGLAGTADNATLTACYAVGGVSGSYYVGGLLGASYSSQITSCFWDKQASGQAASVGGTGKTTEEMKTLSMFTIAGWDFTGEIINGANDYWQMPDNSYPRLAWETIIIDITPPADITDFVCLSDNAQLNLAWTNPADEDFGGVLIVRREGQAPSGTPSAGVIYRTGNSLAGGTVVYVGNASSFNDTALTNGTTYYYQAFSFDTFYNYAAGASTDGTPVIDITPPADIADFICLSGNAQLNLSWINPTDPDFEGILIVRRAGQAPWGSPIAGTPYSIGVSLAEGTVIYAGGGTAFIDTSVDTGTPYYYQAFAYDISYNYAAGISSGGTPVDMTPDPFTFTAQTRIAFYTTVISDTITVSGVEAAVPITITGGNYSINDAAYTSDAGTVNNGDRITVRQTSAGSYSITTNTVLTIGGVSGTFSVTTLSMDDDKTAPADVTELQCLPENRQLNLSWINPTDPDFEGIVITRRAKQPLSGSPTVGITYKVGDSLAGGTVVYVGPDTGFNNTSLTNGTLYYYQVFSFDGAKNYSSGTFLSGTPAIPVIATPVIVSDGLDFYDSIQVTLTCASSFATIRYTTDGTVPTLQSTVYSGPFTLNQTCTVTAKAFYKNYQSNTAQAVYTWVHPFALQTVTVKAGETRGLDSICFTAQLNMQEVDLLNAGKIIVSVDSESLVRPLSVEFPVDPNMLKNGIFSGKLTHVSLKYSSKTGTITFTAKRRNLQGLGCPVAVKIAFGDYVAKATADESIVNGAKECPIRLLQGAKNTLAVKKYNVIKGGKGGMDSLTASGTFTAAGNYSKNPLVITVGDQTFTIDHGNFRYRNYVASCSDKTTRGIAVKLDYKTCTFVISINNVTLGQSGDVEFGLNCFGVDLQALETINLK